MRKNESFLDFYCMSEIKKCRLYNKYDNILSFLLCLGDVKCRLEEFRLKCWIYFIEGNFFYGKCCLFRGICIFFFLWKSIVNCVVCCL